MLKKATVILSIILFTFNCTYADRAPYKGIKEIRVESKNFIVIHQHNWRYKQSLSDKEEEYTKFESLNTSSIICINKRNGDTLFKRPCYSALTHIIISENEDYIIGLSNIKCNNPYQLIIFNLFGDIIKERHISSKEAKLSINELEDFKQKFNSQFEKLQKNNIIYTIDSIYYIDYKYFFLTLNEKDQQTSDYLDRYEKPNHLSNSFSESVTNYIDWYNEENPSIKLIYSSDGLIDSISLLDSQKNRFKIIIIEKAL